MQKTWRILLAILIMSSGSLFGADRWTKADGGWHQPATWGAAVSTYIPQSGDTAYVTNSVYVITDSWKDFDGFYVGKSGVSGAVLISSGGALAPTAVARVGAGAYGALTVDGGSFSTASDFYSGYQTPADVVVSNGTFYVGNNFNVARGYSLNYAGASGSAFAMLNGNVVVTNRLGMGVSGLASGYISVSGGTLLVKNGLILDQGTFTVEGSSASITLAKNVAAAQLDIRANATVKFVFDASGVSEIDFNNKTLELYEGASLEIDGSAFAGAAGTYRLLNAGGYEVSGTNRFSNVTITGFSSFSSATLEYDDAESDINLVLTDGSSYDLWIAEYGLADSFAALDADPDGDQYNNLLEYALGGDPTNSLVQGTTPTASVADGWLEYVHAERSDAVTRGLSYSAQAVSNLVSGMWATNDVEFVGSGLLDADFIRVTNRVSVSGSDAQFMRLQVELQE